MFHLHFWRCVWGESQRKNDNELKTSSVYFKPRSSFPACLLLCRSKSCNSVPLSPVLDRKLHYVERQGGVCFTPSYREPKQGHGYVWFSSLFTHWRDREPECTGNRGRGGESLGQTPRSAGRPVHGSVSEPWDHNTSPKPSQKLNWGHQYVWFLKTKLDSCCTCFFVPFFFLIPPTYGFSLRLLQVEGVQPGDLVYIHC